jgi:hypothetical protein
LSGTPLDLTVTTQRPETDGLTVTPIVEKNSVCTVRVSLPDGLTLEGAPAAASAANELEVSARVKPGAGGTWVLGLGHCVTTGTRVRLALHD